jgi:hypothetical protein
VFEGNGAVPHPRFIGDPDTLRWDVALLHILDHFLLKSGSLGG